MQKRVSAPPAGSVEANNSFRYTSGEHFLPALSNVTEGSVIREVYLASCIPLFLSRPKSANAVRKLVALLTGEHSDHYGDTLLSGMVSGAPTSVIVPLLGTLEHYIDDHLSKLYPNEEDREKMKATFDTWFGVIDGCQLLLALQYLQEKEPSKFRNFKWRVICVRHGLDISQYKKLAIVQNERNKQVYHFESTLYDVLRRLREIHDDIYLKAEKASRTKAKKNCSPGRSESKRTVVVSHKKVAQMYDGGEHDKNTTIRQSVSIAIRLSTRTLEAIGLVMNKTCADIILNNKELNSHSLTSTDSIMSKYDCRLFKRFLCNSTLRGATLFINAVKDGKEEAQVNTIHRARHWCERNQFRPVTANILNELFASCTLSLSEEAKFLKVINDSFWPEKMDTTRENLLRTTISDRELKKHNEDEDNRLVVLPSLWSTFERIHPARALSIIRDEDSDSTEESTPSPPAPEQNEAEENARKEEEEKRKAEEEEKLKEKLRREQLRNKGDEILRDSGILTYVMTFKAFLRDVWLTDNDASRVDLVLSSIPPELDDETLAELPEFCNEVLKPGAYAFFIVAHSHFITLQKLFSTPAFKVCPHPYNIIYEISGLKRRRTTDFPLENGDIAIVVKTKGKHPQGFLPEYALGDEVHDCHSSGLYAAISNAKRCDEMLRKPRHNTAIFPSERSKDLYSYFIRMFSPPGGTVIDPFGGPLTSSLASYETNRRCIAMDTGGILMDYAKGRLRVYVTPGATMQQLDQFTEVIDLDSGTTSLVEKVSESTSGVQIETESPEQRHRVCRIRKIRSSGSPASMGMEEQDLQRSLDSSKQCDTNENTNQSPADSLAGEHGDDLVLKDTPLASSNEDPSKVGSNPQTLLSSVVRRVHHEADEIIKEPLPSSCDLDGVDALLSMQKSS